MVTPVIDGHRTSSSDPGFIPDKPDQDLMQDLGCSCPGFALMIGQVFYVLSEFVVVLLRGTCRLAFVHH